MIRSERSLGAADRLRPQMKMDVLRRDGGICRYCGRSGAKDVTKINFSAEHLPDNLVATCSGCFGRASLEQCTAGTLKEKRALMQEQSLPRGNKARKARSPEVPKGSRCEHIMTVRQGGTGFRLASGRRVYRDAEYLRTRMCRRSATKQVNGKLLCSVHFD